MSESEQREMMIRFGVFELDPAAGELRRSGRLLALAGQPMRVLIQLASRPGEVLTREELQRAVWGEDTHVDFEAGLSTCINQIRSTLGDRASSPRFVETLPRRGYRFIAPIAREASGRPADPESPRPTRRSRIPMAAGLALAAVLVLLLVWLRQGLPPGPIPIVVVPVQIDATRADLDPVSLSLTDALIGTLASEAGARARVASPIAVRHLRGRDVSLQQLSETGAEYFVHVTLRSLGGPILVHAKLAHISGWILWTSDQELALDELERRQLSIAAAVARRVASEILPSTAARRAPRREAVGEYAQALADLDNGRVADSLAGFARARALDGDHPGTLAGLAQSTIDGVWSGAIDRAYGHDQAARDAGRALSLDPENARAIAASGALAWIKDANSPEAESYLSRALALEPTLRWAQVWQSRVRARSRTTSN